MICELLGGALAAGTTRRDDNSGRMRMLDGRLSILIDPSALLERERFEAEALAFLE